MRIRWTIRAKCDLVATLDYLETDDLRKAERFEERIIEAVGSLATLPNRGRPGRVEGTRELVMHDLPYVIVYRVRGGQVEVLRVAHAARRYPEAP